MTALINDLIADLANLIDAREAHDHSGVILVCASLDSMAIVQRSATTIGLAGAEDDLGNVLHYSRPAAERVAADWNNNMSKTAWLRVVTPDAWYADRIAKTESYLEQYAPKAVS